MDINLILSFCEKLSRQTPFNRTLFWLIRNPQIYISTKIGIHKFKWFGFTPLSTIFTYIMAVSFIDGGNRSTRGKPPTCRKSLTNFITKCCNEYPSPCVGFEHTMLGTDCIDSCKSNYDHNCDPSVIKI